jgi:hypothetical protein
MFAVSIVGSVLCEVLINHAEESCRVCVGMGVCVCVCVRARVRAILKPQH